MAGYLRAEGSRDRESGKESKEGISWIILSPSLRAFNPPSCGRQADRILGFLPAFPACNNKFSLDAALSTAHNWRHRGGKGWWTGDPLATQPPLLHHLCLSSALSISSHSLCTPWLHGPGAILGCVWIGTRGCACSPLHPFSIYLSLPIHSRSRLHARTHPSIHLSLSLSLSGAMIIRLCPPCRHIRRVYDSVPLVPVDACPPPALHNTVPTVYYSVRPFLRRVSGRRGKRFMGGGWPEKLGETGKKELPILGNDVSPWDIFCAPHPLRILGEPPSSFGWISHLDD